MTAANWQRSRGRGSTGDVLVVRLAILAAPPLSQTSWPAGLCLGLASPSHESRAFMAEAFFDSSMGKSQVECSTAPRKE